MEEENSNKNSEIYLKYCEECVRSQIHDNHDLSAEDQEN
jgi:hypothetical protein